MSDLADLSIDELLTLFRTREATPLEALNACLGRVDRLDDRVNAVITLLVERATAQAEESTKRWQSGEARPLEGIPYGLKDIIETAGIRTTGGSPMYENYIPEESATLVDRLEAAGAVLVGKLQTFEFASGSNATTSNPWDLSRWPAGSSSGPAAAVAAHEMPLSIGTDTGGSIAIPAAFCGIVGLKATYGRISRAGVFPLSWTLDHAGPMTRSALDAAHALGVMAGYDPRDPTCGNVPVPDYAASLRTDLGGVRIGVPTEWFFDVCAPEVEAATRAAIELLAEQGATINEFQLPSTRTVQLHAIELTIVYSEVASLHEATLERLDEYGPEFQRLLTRAQFTSAVDYLKALRARHLVQLDFEQVFEQNDVVVVPGGMCVAPSHDHLVAKVGDEERPLIDVISRPTAVMDIVGLPAITIPAGFDDGLPIGVQIAARPYDELSCLSVAHAYQRLTDFHTALPPIVKDDLDAGPSDLSVELPVSIEKPVVTATRDRIW